MKKLVFFVLITQTVLAQKSPKNSLNFNFEFRAAFTSKLFFGDNYLSKGHHNPSQGVILKVNIIEFNNFKLGGSFDRSTIKVSDYSIGGKIDKTNINGINGNISYRIELKNKFALEPQLSAGNISLIQNSGGKSYGTQTGKVYSAGVDFIYKFNEMLQFFTNVEISKYQFQTNTSSEFQSYFDNSNSLNVSIGIKL